MKFSGRMGRGTRNNRLDVVGDRQHDPHPGLSDSLFTITIPIDSQESGTY